MGGQEMQDVLVTVHATDRPGEVAVVKMALSDAFIPYIAVNDVVSGVLTFDGMVWVQFRVRQGDADRALEVLRELGVARGST